MHSIGKNKRETLIEKAGERYIAYINRITSYNFSNLDETFTFLDRITTSQELFSNLKEIKFLPGLFQNINSLDSFLENFTEQEIKPPFGDKSIGWNFGLYLQSQFIRVQEHKYFCERLIAEPIYDYELPWFFYTYEAGAPNLDASIANSLQKEKFQWLTKVPIKAIKEFREENTLDYMRSILRTGITDLKAKTDKDLSVVSAQLQKNMKDAFKQQSSEIRTLEKKVLKATNIEIPLTTAGFLAGFIPYLGSVVSLCMAGRDIKKLIKERKEAEKILSAKKSNLINLLMRTSDE